MEDCFGYGLSWINYVNEKWNYLTHETGSVNLNYGSRSGARSFLTFLSEILKQFRKKSLFYNLWFITKLAFWQHIFFSGPRKNVRVGTGSVRNIYGSGTLVVSVHTVLWYFLFQLDPEQRCKRYHNHNVNPGIVLPDFLCHPPWWLCTVCRYGADVNSMSDTGSTPGKTPPHPPPPKKKKPSIQFKNPCIVVPLVSLCSTCQREKV